MTMSASARPLKRALLVGCALAALGSMAGQAHAQAFNGTPTTQFGGVIYDRATPGVETVRVTTNTAVIDWRPTGGTFLPAGNVATFTNNVDNLNFVVLNRILSTTPVQFDGSVLSRLIDVNGAAMTGGTVIFSSPGGLIVGSTGVFDVGSLVLTTLNVDVDANGIFYDPLTRGISLSSGPSPIGNPAVVTQVGAQLNALQPNSYVALIGPVVQHAGATRVNGSAAYVAGEQVTFRANQGLFDIIVDTGSAAATPLSHTGSTGGPSNVAAGDNHAIYLVAMPKNQAITAVLQGDIGFDPAVTAGVENGVIVLSAGANIVGGEVDRYGHDAGIAASPDQQASFEINGGTVRSDLIGVARTNIRARPTGGSPTLTFQQDVSLSADQVASISVSTGQTVNVLGNALVSAAVFDTPTPAGLNLTGGQARIFTNDGGTIHIFGTATVDASARGLPGNAGTPGTGTGGSADVSAAAGGSITVDGALSIVADGQGAVSPDPPQVDGAAGTGGSASITSRSGGTVIANSTVTMSATGDASFSGLGATRNAATGTGGAVQVLALSNGTITIAGAFSATANGFGGPQLDFGGPFAGGTGQGGGIGIGAGVGTVTFNGSVNLSAFGSGGAGPTGGQGTGGSIQVQAAIGTINFNGGVIGNADGSGGDSTTAGVQGGTGQGGTVRVAALSGTGASRIGGTAINLTASGQGGRGGNPLVGQTGGAGGTGIGGSVSVLGESGNGVVDLGAVQLAADGTGGAGGAADTDTGGGAGGTGTGGTVVIGTQATSNVPQTTGGATFASADLGARGFGGTGGFGTGTGGNGTGGTASVAAVGAPVTVTGATNLSANGVAGAGGDSPSGAIGGVGRGSGGSVNLSAVVSPLTGATGSTSLAAVTGSASGIGPSSTGNIAGAWHVGASGGSSLAAANLTLTATAQGTAPGAPPASTLDPQNGTINVSGTAQLSTAGDIQVNATQNGRIIGGRYELVSGRDIAVSHAAPAAGAFTFDVANLFLQAARDVTVNAGAVTRTSAITDVRALRLATIAGRMTGQEIRIGSIDLDLQATGQIGDAATQLVILDVDGGDNGALFTGTPGLALGPNQFTVLGGTTAGPGYTLTTAEAGRIRGGTLRILAPALGTAANRAPDLIIRDLGVTGGGATAGLGTLEIISPGIGRVEGNVLMTGARAQDGVLIDARDRLEVVTPTASVRVRDGNGAPAGTLTLVSNNIWVASSALIDLLRADPNYVGRDDDLIDNDGVDAPRGYVEGNSVQLTTRGTLFVQNTTAARGTFLTGADFGGVTTGPGGLRISALGASPASVYAFGRRLNADGTVTTGDDFFFNSTYDAGGGALTVGYTTNAAVNTCIIVTGQCRVRVPPDSGIDGKQPITGPTDGSVAIVLPPGEPDDIIDSSFAADPLIEEPVTSGSEPGEWNCDPDHDGDCDDQPR